MTNDWRFKPIDTTQTWHEGMQPLTYEHDRHYLPERDMIGVWPKQLCVWDELTPFEQELIKQRHEDWPEHIAEHGVYIRQLGEIHDFLTGINADRTRYLQTLLGRITVTD